MCSTLPAAAIIKKGGNSVECMLTTAVPFGSFINSGMSRSKRDSDPWTDRHGNRGGQPDPVLPGVSEEEEQQHTHPPLVCVSSRCSHSLARFLLRALVASCPRALSVSDRQVGHEESEAVWELHPSLPAAKVSPVRGNGGRGVQAEDCQRDGDGPGFLHL